MRALIYTILGLITLGMISTAVLSQETDQNWRLIYRPMAVQPAQGDGGTVLCVTRFQLETLAKFFNLNFAEDLNYALLSTPGKKIEVTFDDFGCATSAKVIQ
jgi:hypothetical protein